MQLIACPLCTVVRTLSVICVQKCNAASKFRFCARRPVCPTASRCSRRRRAILLPFSRVFYARRETKRSQRQRGRNKQISDIPLFWDAQLRIELKRAICQRLSGDESAYPTTAAKKDSISKIKRRVCNCGRHKNASAETCEPGF